MANAANFDLYENFDRLSLNDDNDKWDENCHSPSTAWSKLKGKIKKDKIKSLPLETPISDDKLRVVCISDTNSRISKMTHPIPKGDILIHAGDFTKYSHTDEIEEFNSYLQTRNDIKHKIVICGNHETSFYSRSDPSKKSIQDVKSLLTGCIYLEDSEISLYGIKFYGSPWQPRHCGNAFQLQRGKPLYEKWMKIPNDTDILITHGPPLGFGDLVDSGYNVGCVDLLNAVTLRVKPKFHIFGHVHEGYGYWSDGTTKYINASICNSHYKPVNKPIIFDLDLPAGQTK